MIATIFLLILSVIVVPTFSYLYGTPLTELQSEIMESSLWVLAGVITYCFVVAEISRNYSQTDKLWSVIPIYYVWHITCLAGFPPKMILMSCLVTLWGARLTFNFARRGGYSLKFWDGDEDYRWEILRKRPGLSNKYIWSIFNLFFIAGYQQALIFLFTIPIILVAGNSSANTITLWDIMISVLMILFIILEFIADQQQFNFQSEKHRRIREGVELDEYKHGFVRTGLWSIVRHPNYSMEQAIWVCFYLFSVSATGEWLNWSVTGCLLLIILFKSSSDFSEDISASKYPEYKEYQKKTPRFIPFTK